MSREMPTLISGVLLDEHVELTLGEMSRACAISAEVIVTLVEEGLLAPRDPLAEVLRFPASELPRLRMALRLQRDLELNPAGAALAVELIEEIQRLRARLRTLEAELER